MLEVLFKVLEKQYLTASDILLRAKHDLKCGLHSGMPPCCVLFYTQEGIFLNYLKLSRFKLTVNGKVTILNGVFKYLTRYNDWYQKHNKANTHGFNYVPCPFHNRFKFHLYLNNCECHKKVKLK